MQEITQGYRRPETPSPEIWVPVHNKKQVDQIRIVRDEACVVSGGIGSPADLDHPAVLAFMCSRFDLNTLDSIRPRYQDRIGIVRDEACVVSGGIGSPADLDHPAVLAFMCSRFDLNTLDSIRPRY